MATLAISTLIGNGLIGLLGFLLGFGLFRLLQKPQQQRLTTELLALQQQLNVQQQQLTEYRIQEGKLVEKNQFNESNAKRLQLELASSKQELKQLQVEFNTLQNNQTALKTLLSERDASHQRELSQFEQQKQRLVEQFKALSNDILEAKAQSLQESSKSTLNTVLAPFQQSMEAFKKEVQDIHHRETTAQGELKKELASLKLLNQQITQEAHELSTALRGQKKLQGNWGELVLENVLDRAGLQQGKDYDREVSFTTDEGKFRPDAIVYLPQNKHLVIDAKVSLNAYSRYVNSEQEAERLLALKEHVQAISNRIKELSAKDYFNLPGLNSPDMVFMFIPIESAFVEALKADETLFMQAIENNILVATPTTLLTSLNIVRQLWRYEDQNKHTAALASKAESVFKKLNTFLASFEKVKRGLDSAQSAYQAAENQLISGKGNLVKQVSDFRQLAPAIRAELPEYFVEKAELEVDLKLTQDAVEQKA
ncbi:DNA recombination protein RmuC [Alishewanella sp. d11]|uniref:DNA recombination protein RmuC n=1 Tax=Alishewanella sp. d11 TaxID=3414030 RepID=UPI003BF863B4